MQRQSLQQSNQLLSVQQQQMQMNQFLVHQQQQMLQPLSQQLHQLASQCHHLSHQVASLQLPQQQLAPQQQQLPLQSFGQPAALEGRWGQPAQGLRQPCITQALAGNVAPPGIGGGEAQLAAAQNTAFGFFPTNAC